MIKEIRICDKCGKEVNALASITVESKHHFSEYGLCYDCISAFQETIKAYPQDKVMYTVNRSEGRT